MKGYYRDLYDTYMIDAPINPSIEHPFIPSHQLCAIWVVNAWKQVPEALVKKAWVIGNYMPFEKLQSQDINELISNEIVNYNQNNIFEAITQVMSNDNLLQYFLAADNVYADSKFCDDNMFD